MANVMLRGNVEQFTKCFNFFIIDIGVSSSKLKFRPNLEKHFCAVLDVFPLLQLASIDKYLECRRFERLFHPATIIDLHYDTMETFLIMQLQTLDNT